MTRQPRVGIVCYGFDRPITGIGRYTLELIRNLAKSIGPSQITLFETSPLGNRVPDSIQRIPMPEARRVPGLLIWGGLKVLTIAKQLKLDILHDPTGLAPFIRMQRDVKTVITIHDVIPRIYPREYPLFDRLIFSLWYAFQMKRVDAIITPSESSARDIEQYFGISREKITTIPHGISQHFRRLEPTQVERFLQSVGIHNRPYFLCVGAITKRKNLEVLFDAARKFLTEHPEYYLILVGPKSYKADQILRYANTIGLSRNLRHFGHVDDEGLIYFYSGAKLLIFPSRYEGFGFPPLEAMACGTPVICSNTSSLPEIVEDAAILCSPSSAEEFHRAIHFLLFNEDGRREQIRKGYRRVRKYTWEAAIASVLEVYSKVAGEKLKGEMV